MYNLDDSFQRGQLTALIAKDVDEACIANMSSEHRDHLGASLIGDPCEQKLWLEFRFAKLEHHDARMRRLFNRGHEEEVRFIRWLMWAGFEVQETDPETHKQFRITGSKGHFGGSLDGLLKPPTKYEIIQCLIWLGEFKTHSDKSFKELQAKKVQLSKPKHFKQMCSYGKFRDTKYGLYCAVNKNTDELYFEIVELNFALAEDLYRKADNIIFSQTPRPKIAQTKTYFDCKYCHFSGICHDGEAPEKNCRSCKMAIPIENAQWGCTHWNEIIPKEIILNGCKSWTRII